MIGDIFLSYANTRLNNNPGGLYKIIDDIRKNILINLDDLNIVLEAICEYSDHEKVVSMPKPFKGFGLGGPENPPHITIAIEATYGLRALKRLVGTF